MGKEISYLEALEIVNSYEKKPAQKISSPQGAMMYLRKYGGKKEENFYVVTLDAAHCVIRTHHVTKGILNRTIIHPREVFLRAIKDKAAAVIIAHNHPSGDCTFSPEDRKLTTRMEQAGEILGIVCLDHIVFSKNEWKSATAGTGP